MDQSYWEGTLDPENSGQIWSEVKQKLSFCSFRQEYSVVHFDRSGPVRPAQTDLSMIHHFIYDKSVRFRPSSQ